MPPKKKTNKFAKAFEELEGIVAWFDSDEQMDLDEGLKKFEQGLELAGVLKKKLSEVENSIKEIKAKFEDV